MQERKKFKAPPTLLEWKVVHKRMPWNIILLLGGGYALASGSEVKKQKQKRTCENSKIHEKKNIYFDKILKSILKPSS